MELPLSPWYYVLIAVGFICVTAIMIVLIIAENKRAIGSTERKPDPVSKSVMLTCAVLMIMLVGSIFVYNLFKNFWWVSLIIFASLLMFYTWSIRRVMPLNVSEQLAMFKENLKDMFGGDDFKGDENILPFDAYRTSREAGRSNVGNWLKSFHIAGTAVDFLWQIDKESREILTIIPNPSGIVKQKMLEKVFSKKPVTMAEQMGGEEDVKETVTEIEKEQQQG